jgi:N-acyl-phosphatidylethanolamine-hydrolysing phospholipase D
LKNGNNEGRNYLPGGPTEGLDRDHTLKVMADSRARRILSLRAARWVWPSILLGLLLVGGGASLTGAEIELPAQGPLGSARLAGSHYLNQDPHYSRGPFAARLRTFVTGMTWLVGERRVAALPAGSPDLKRLGDSRAEPSVTWIGHSTVLVQLDGVTFLTDPTWSDIVGPFGVIGVRRYTPPGIPFEALPRIDVVLISHDHYDHLDAETVDRLAREHHPRFFVPLGLRAWLGERGITDVVELDWWDRVSFRDLTFVCTPAQHSSGRTFSDQYLRLWSSWVVFGPTKRFFFAGDTGYDPRMKAIGERYGPFDLAMIPIGGYSSFKTAHPNHVNPEEAVQLYEDVRGRLLVPMHWGTFAMNREPFREPPDRLLREALNRGLEEQVAILSPGQTVPW